jgi:DNA-binding beta-propeller fold protein YncE
MSSIALSLVLAAVLAAGAALGQAQKLERPVMMDSNGPGSELFILDAAGSLHEFHVTQNSLQEYRKVSLPHELTPADMTFAATGGQGSVLIAATDSGRGVVVNFSLDGRSLRTWSFRNICSGIDFGPTTQSAYVATSDSNELYRLDLKGGKVTFVTRIEDATKLGPVAFDEVGQEIYVADVASGKIYQYSIATKTSKVLLTGLSAPTALAFDQEANRLFVADPGRGGIFTVDTRSNKPVATELASSSLKSPSGITLISNGRVAVADYSANRAVVFSKSGELLFRFPSSD